MPEQIVLEHNFVRIMYIRIITYLLVYITEKDHYFRKRATFSM